MQLFTQAHVYSVCIGVITCSKLSYASCLVCVSFPVSRFQD